MNPSTESANSKTAEELVFSQARPGVPDGPPARAGVVSTRGKWSAWARVPSGWKWPGLARLGSGWKRPAWVPRPGFLPDLELASRQVLLLLVAILMAGTCAALALWTVRPGPISSRQDGIHLHDASTSPNLYNTSTNSSSGPTSGTLPSEHGQLGNNIDPKQAVAETIATPSLLSFSEPRVSEAGAIRPLTSVEPECIVPATLVQPNHDLNIATQHSHRGESPMIRNWRLLGLNTLLASAVAMAPARAADPPLAVEKQLEEIKKSIADLSEAIRGDMATSNTAVGNLGLEVKDLRGKLSKAQVEIDSLQAQIKKLQTEWNDLRASRKSFATPAPGAEMIGTGTGKLMLLNTYTTPMTIVVNDKSFTIGPGEFRFTDPMPAGSFTYEVLGVEPRRDRTLAANETFTIKVHPR